MAELLKNYFNDALFKRLTTAIQKITPRFDEKSFMREIYDSEWEQRELKQRMRHITITLHDLLQMEYEEGLEILLKTLEQLQKEGVKSGIEYIFFPDFIEHFGLDHPDLSLKAMESVTQFITCEFAVRPFIKKYPEKVLAQMLEWSKHESEQVRRFASEGCRPRLPWAMALPELKKDPAPILAILENLKNDPSEFVRRSVANNLNDIAKDNPQVVLEIAQKWKDQSAETDWILKHGCRTLLRQADPATMKLFGLARSVDCRVKNLQISQAALNIGEDLHFSFELVCKEKEPIKMRVEYGIYYVKSNGKPSRKLFKITENTYAPQSSTLFNRKQSFRDLTTRKHYAGQHKLAIVVNGVELASTEFQLD